MISAPTAEQTPAIIAVLSSSPLPLPEKRKNDGSDPPKRPPLFAAGVDADGGYIATGGAPGGATIATDMTDADNPTTLLRLGSKESIAEMKRPELMLDCTDWLADCARFASVSLMMTVASALSPFWSDRRLNVAISVSPAL